MASKSKYNVPARLTRRMARRRVIQGGIFDLATRERARAILLGLPGAPTSNNPDNDVFPAEVLAANLFPNDPDQQRAFLNCDWEHYMTSADRTALNAHSRRRALGQDEFPGSEALEPRVADQLTT